MSSSWALALDQVDYVARAKAAQERNQRLSVEREKKREAERVRFRVRRFPDVYQFGHLLRSSDAPWSWSGPDHDVRGI